VTISIICELPAKPDAVEELKNFLQEVLSDTRAFKGCQQMLVVQEQEKPERFVIIERWESKDDHLKYLAWRGERNEIQPAYKWLTSDPLIQYFDDTNV
jgi:quinol monooxygenase YgiN